MLRCDSCEMDFDPRYLDTETDGNCPGCGFLLHEPGCDECGEHYDDCLCATPRPILRAPPAAVARFAALSK